MQCIGSPHGRAVQNSMKGDRRSKQAVHWNTAKQWCIEVNDRRLEGLSGSASRGSALHKAQDRRHEGSASDHSTAVQYRSS